MHCKDQRGVAVVRSNGTESCCSCCCGRPQEAPDQRRQSQGHRRSGEAKMGWDTGCEAGAETGSSPDQHRWPQGDGRCGAAAVGGGQVSEGTPKKTAPEAPLFRR